MESTYSRRRPTTTGECKCNQWFRPLQTEYTSSFHLIPFCRFWASLMKQEKNIENQAKLFPKGLSALTYDDKIIIIVAYIFQMIW